MNCSECQDLLSEFIDGDLEEAKHGIVKMHTESCRDCYSVLQDLEQIVIVSRDLPLLAPQNALWKQIEDEIKELTEPNHKRRQGIWQRFWGYRLQFTLSMPQLAGGVICLAMLGTLASVVSYLPQQASTLGMATQATVSARPVTVEINPEEAELTGAIDRLSHTVNQRRSSWDPELQSLFDRNLSIVERSVNDCRQMVQRNQQDHVAHEMLIIAYQEKLRLFEQFASL